MCELDGLIAAENFDNIIIIGDFNCDLSRPGPNCSNLISFMDSHDLIAVDQLYNIRYTYHKDDFSCFSSPDHILTKCNFSNLIDSVYASDPVENFSDHLSLHFSFNLSDSLSLLSVPTILTTVIDILVLTILPLLLIGLKLTQITFLIIVTIFHPSSLSFHLTFFVVVILTVLLTIKTSRTIVFNSSIVLSLQRIYVSPSIVVAGLLFLDGITQRIP